MVISAGNAINAGETIDITKIVQVYTGTGFNSTQSGAGTTSGTYDMASISAASLINANYLIIKILGDAKGTTTGGGGVHPQLGINTKYIGGAYVPDPTSTDLIYVYTGGTGGASYVSNSLIDLIWVHTLTANEKANGVQVQVYSNSVVDNNGTGSAGCSATFVNKQVTIQIKP